MNERKLKILQAVVDDYIMTAVPVGSRTIARKYLDWSSATIRNEMMDLEELGYLDQPHTSAGRIPSERAYRLYVERLMHVSDLQPEEVDYLRQHVKKRSDDLRQTLRDTASAIADATSYTALVMPPKMRNATIKNIQLVPLATSVALLVLVTDVGIFKDTVLQLGEDFSDADIRALSQQLRAFLSGRTLKDAEHQVRTQMQGVLSQQRAALERVLDSLGGQQQKADTASLLVEGTSKILQHPEYANVEKAAAFLSALETREGLGPLLARAQDFNFTVSIGSENGTDAMRDCSIVTVTYRVGDEPMGSIGVIGPTRMNYSHVAGVLHYMSCMLGQILIGAGDDAPNKD
nr:heat-inducible transcriptional repressor HrcA [Maliibacterium massiliense]